MERAASFFGRAGEVAQNFYRWLILFLRKYPLAALVYMAIFLWYIFSFANQSVQPPPPPPSAQYPAPPANTAPVPAAATAPAPAAIPAIPVAQARALKNGNTITIRWNRPVVSPSLYSDSGMLTANCQPPSQPQTCSAALPQQASQVEASWLEGSDRVKTDFRL